MGMYFVKDWYCKPYKKTYQGIWVPKTWNEFAYISGNNIWTDGTDIYYSSSAYQYVLDKSTSTWSEKTWDGLTSFHGQYIWTDGTDIYYTYSAGTSSRINKVLNKNGSTWTNKTWRGALANETIYGYAIWHPDNDRTFYSIQGKSYWLNKDTSSWTKFSSSPTNLSGNNIWTDGENIYYSYYQQYNVPYHYVLTDVNNFTWTSKTWNYNYFSGSRVWTDGTDIYYSSSTDQYVLDKATSTWVAKTWQGLTSFYGSLVWKDGDHIYYSDNGINYELT